MVGTPESSSSIGLTVSRVRGPANSDRNTAITVPSGMATSSATPELTSVPDSSTTMPKWASSNSGVHCVSVRKSHSGTCLKNTTDSDTRM